MRLPNPLAAYRRWFQRWRCRQAGIDVEFAERLSEVGRVAGAAGGELTDHFVVLALEGYSGEALLMELRRRLEAPAL